MRAALGLLLATASAASIALAAPAAASPETSRGGAPHGAISSVRVGDRSVRVEGRVTPRSRVELRDLAPWQDTGDWASAPVLATRRVSASGRVDAVLPRSANGRDLLYDRILPIVDGVPVGEGSYVTDYALRAANRDRYPVSDTVKGLTVAQLTDDAEDLGVGHSLVNLSLNTLLVPAAGAPGSTIAFTSGGRQWYVDAARVQKLDRTFRVLTDDGIVPSVILKLDQPASATPVPALVHPDAVPGAVGGEQFMFNTATADGVAAFTAIIEFATRRWTSSDGAHGLVPNWIVGNEIDQAYKWMNMGPASLDRYVDTYSRALRIVDAAVHSAYANGRVSVPLTNCWTDVCGTNPDPASPTEYYTGRTIIDALAAHVRAQGDIDWGVAYHPYPGDLLSPEVWKDTNATDSFDTPRISPKNIQVLPRYLRQPVTTYRGRLRHIAATEWGCQTRSYRETDLQEQAACFAYSAYRFRFTDGIEWFNYYRDLDYETTSSSALEVGLRATDPEQPTATQPVGDPKPIYAVMRDIDTSRSLQATEFAKKIIGIRDWSEVVPGFDPRRLATRDEPTTAGTSLGGDARDTRALAAPQEGRSGWHVADNATSVTAAGGAMQVAYSAKAAKQGSGARLDLARPTDARSRSTLVVRLRAPGDAAHRLQSGVSWSTTVRAYAADGSRLDARARIIADGSEQTVSADLGGWRGASSLSAVKVQLSASSNRPYDGAFTIDGVALARGVGGADGSGNLALSATVPAASTADIGPGSTVTVTVTNQAAVPVASDGTLVACDGVSVDPATVPLRGLALGRSRTATAVIRDYAPADPTAPQLCLQLGGQRIPVRIALSAPPPPPDPGSPDTYPSVEFSDDFATDSLADYERFAPLPEANAVPETTVGQGALTATSGSDWFGAYRSSVAPTSPRVSTVLTIGSFAPNGVGNVVYTGLVKDARNDVMGVYVKSARYAAFEVRLNGKVALTGQISNLDLPDGTRLGFSLDSPSASLWADTGSGWNELGSTVLRQAPDLSDPAELAQWHYGFALRSLAGETITATHVDGRSIP